MLINWFTVGAQAVNFIVLVWLLQRFLYKPILNAIGAREKRVAGELANAEQQKNAVNKSRDDLQAKGHAFDAERGALLAAAILNAKQEADRLLDAARQAADALTAQRNAALQSEMAKLTEELSILASAESMNIARAALKNIADADLEARMCAVFVRRLRAIDAPTKDKLGAVLKSPGVKPVVTSCFELSAADAGAIQTALNETYSADIPLRFETSSSAIAGIELSAGGERLSWTITDYLKTLEEKVAALLNAGSVTEAISAKTSSVRPPPNAAATPSPTPTASPTATTSPTPAPSPTPTPPIPKSDIPAAAA